MYTCQFNHSCKCYYYYYRKKRFRWHSVKPLQGHLTNTKQNSTSVTQQNEQSIWAKCLSDTDSGRAVGIRKASGEQFCLQLTPESRRWSFTSYTSESNSKTQYKYW